MSRPAVALAALLAAATAIRLPAAWESGNALNHVSGVWLALADDLARGTLYRPLRAGEAFGGTRYFPLVFSAQAALVEAGLPPLAAGEAVSLGAGLLLALGLARLVRAAGAGRTAAGVAAALAFAGLGGQRALADARGDLLPVALSALALAIVARRAASGGRASAGVGRDRRRPDRAGPRGGVAAAALLLVLAFAAKPTALSAAAAAVLALGLRGERRAAGALAALVAAGAAGVVVATDALSGGRFLAALGGSAVAGLSWRTALAAPLRLATEAAQEDLPGLALALLAAAALAAAAPALRRATRARRGDPRLVGALWLTFAWAAALAVYASPGTGVNHLLEVEAASAALLATAAVAGPRPSAGAVRTARAACAVVAAAGLAGAVALWSADRSTSRLAEVRAVAAALPPGPVLSEDPLVPLMSGTSPILLDPFAIRAVPAMSGTLAAALLERRFAAVVLLMDLEDAAATEWYERGNLGPSLADAVRAGYRRAGAFGRYHLYVPRGGRAGAARADAGVVPRDAPR